MLIRQATLDDIPALLRHRRGMYEDMGYNDPVALVCDGLDLHALSGCGTGERYAEGLAGVLRRPNRGRRRGVDQPVAQPSL